MSGHSHWATTKRDKAVTDAKKSQIFTKMSRLITVAARQGGGDVDSNATLRLAVEKAKEARMPKDNIQKAIDKGTGKLAGETLEEITYEGYGPEGVAFMVKTVTDNRNRTVGEMRNVFSKNGGSLGGAGSTTYIFGNTPENPSFYVDITDNAVLGALESFVEALEDLDDVTDVYFNFHPREE